MDYELLETLVSQGDMKKLAQLLGPMNEGERKRLSTKVGKLHKALDAYVFDDDKQPKAQKEIRDRVFKKITMSDKQYRPIVLASGLAALGVCPLSVTKRLHMRSYSGDECDLVLKVLKDRQPGWADDWLGEMMQGEYPSITWATFRRLLENGVCRKPSTDAYYDTLAFCLNTRNPSYEELGYQSLSAYLRDYPDLLDDVWKFFEIQTSVFANDFGNHSKYEAWEVAIAKLAEAGDLDRQTLLDACLSGMTMGFKQNTLSGYTKLFEMLDPTVDEIADRQSKLHPLLSVQTSHVVTFAIKQFKRLSKAKKLDTSAFLGSADRVFALTKKSQPKAVLIMIKPILKEQPEHRVAGISLAFEGLTHPDADVQSSALALLTEYADEASADAAYRLSSAMDDLPQVLLRDAEVLLGKLEETHSSGITGTIAQDTSSAAGTAELLDDLRTRSAKLEPGLCELLGVNDAIKAADELRPAPPLSFGITQAPVLSASDPVTPIASVDELLDAAAYLVENFESADQVERVLDGVARLCDQRTADFDARYKPLRKRLGFNENYPDALPALLIAWSEPDHEVKFPKRGRAIEISGFMEARVREIRLWIKAGVSRQLLSTPTHSGGWIDPRVFVQRLVDAQAKGVQLGIYDVTVALLRLAPDGREQALDAAVGLDGDIGAATRWALGITDTAALQKHVASPDGMEPEDAGLWFAAARARQPLGRLAELEDAGFELPLPGGTGTTSVDLRLYERHFMDAGRKCKSAQMEISVKPPPRKNPEANAQLAYCFPMVHYMQMDQWHYVSAQCCDPRWIESCWPANNEANLAHAIRSIYYGMDYNPTSDDPSPHCMHGLFPPDRPWTETARLTVWLGLASRNQDVSGLALDALIEAVADGRAAPDAMADSLLTFSPLDCQEWLKHNRLATHLGALSCVSDLHAWFAAYCLQRLVANWQAPPRDAYHVLSVLLEVLMKLEFTLDQAAEKTLAAVSGSSKTAKLAKRLLKLEAKAENPALSRVFAQQAQARVERAERWAAANQ
ncbi:MAG: DUF6493 family protein [Planctomycetota bacterium]